MAKRCNEDNRNDYEEIPFWKPVIIIWAIAVILYLAFIVKGGW